MRLARDEGVDRIAQGLGIDWAEVETNAAMILRTGFLSTVKNAQQKLRAERSVVDISTAREFAHDTDELFRFEEMSTGAPQLVGKNFVPNWGCGVRERIGTGPDVGPALQVHIAEAARRGHVLIVPLKTLLVAAIRDGVTVHVSERFLREKETDVMGRPIPDYSNTATGVAPNDPELRDQLRDKWGQITHPTPVSLCEAMASARVAAPGQQVEISRVDIRSAYTKVLIKPEHTAILTVLVCNDHPKHGTVVAVPLVNQWGAQGAGYIFEVLSRNLLRRSKSRLAAFALPPPVIMYVDDHVAIAPRHVLHMELTRFSSDTRALLGPDAIAEEKTLVGQIIDVIGYRADAIRWRIGPSSKALAKIFHVFFVEFPPDTRPGTRVAISQLQRLSAYAIRYSATIVPLRPFSASFAANTGGNTDRKSRKRALSVRSVADLEIWRDTLRRIFERPLWLSVPIEWPIMAAAAPEMACAAADIVVFADAQGTDGGLGVFIPDTLWMYAQMCEMFMDDNGKSVPLSNNASECTADVLAVVAAIELMQDPTGKHIHVRTDNEAAVSWINKGRAPGTYQNFLISFLCLLQVEKQVLVTASHIPGADNITADAISRKFQVPNGPAIAHQLAVIPRAPTPRIWPNFCDALKSRSPTQSQVRLAARTALANVRTQNSSTSPVPLTSASVTTRT